MPPRVRVLAADLALVSSVLDTFRPLHLELQQIIDPGAAVKFLPGPPIVISCLGYTSHYTFDDTSSAGRSAARTRSLVAPHGAVRQVVLQNLQ